MADTLIPVVAQYTATDVTALRELTNAETIPVAYIPTTIARTASPSFTGNASFVETTDTVFTITDAAAFEIDPSNGNVQIVTLGASRTPTATNFIAGQCVLLGITYASTYTITWPTLTWVSSTGSQTAPTKPDTGATGWYLIWKAGTTLFGAVVGKTA